MQLLCFPHAGAGPSQFRAWRAAGLEHLDVTAVALPGRDARFSETPLRDLTALLEDALETVRPRLDRPFVLIGHSMGALVAFEFARLLRRRALPQPEHLFVSAFRAPQLSDSLQPIHALPEPLLRAELMNLNGTPPDVLSQPEFMGALLRALRADLEILERYRYRPEAPLSCPITCLGGLTDHRIGRDQLAAWRRQTAAAFRLRLFPGGHFFLYQTPVLIQRAICADLGLSPATRAAGQASQIGN